MAALEAKDVSSMLSKRVAKVNIEICVACGACENVCPKGAVKVHRGCYAKVDEQNCVGCGKCSKICPGGCIYVEERENR